MASSISLSSLPNISTNITHKSGIITHERTYTKPGWMNKRHTTKQADFEALKLRAVDDDQPSTMPNSLLCADCEGKGCKNCSQCKGSGVNSEDQFDGKFKAGARCWLCGGKKEVLCGNCNGAGFIGGFMSTFDR